MIFNKLSEPGLALVRPVGLAMMVMLVELSRLPCKYC
jgi:hypothetical protein